MGTLNGKIIGGCLESVLHLRGTEYWPDFKDSILFWEISEGTESPEVGQEIEFVDSYLTDLELNNLFREISGMIIGIPYGYDDEKTEALKKLILDKMESYEFPILSNVNIGHCDPIITVPIGVEAEINSKENIFKINSSCIK